MARRSLPLDRFHLLLAKANAAGAARLTLYRTRWHIAGDCQNPYTTFVEGRRERHRPSDPGGNALRPVWTPGTIQNQLLEIDTRCRRCDACLKTRSRRWRGAAKAEMRASTRTWFGTLTLSPQSHHIALSQARHAEAIQGGDFDALTEEEQFAARCRAIAPELTKYLKRFRKNKPGLRYLLVTEKHESGLPHYHMLVHEAPLGSTVTHHDLASNWKLGFEKWRLAPAKNPGVALYLCKYLAKSLQARVRASQGYGVTTSDLHTYVIDQLRLIDRENIF